MGVVHKPDCVKAGCLATAMPQAVSKQVLANTSPCLQAKRKAAKLGCTGPSAGSSDYFTTGTLRRLCLTSQLMHGQSTHSRAQAPEPPQGRLPQHHYHPSSRHPKAPKSINLSLPAHHSRAVISISRLMSSQSIDHMCGWMASLHISSEYSSHHLTCVWSQSSLILSR